jgi:hypothetical protein
MTYPPVNPGYPAAQSGGYGGPAGPAPAAGPGKAPTYLSAAVVVLGLAAYLASFGPLLSLNADVGPFGGAELTASGLSYWTVAALVAALLAAVAMLPKATRTYTAVIAVAAVLGLLLVIGQVINRPSAVSVGWALWLVLLFTLLQAAVAVTALLFEAGVLSAPAPRPRYDQYGQYGQYGPPPVGYYGQPGVAGPPQPPGYPAQYGYPAGSYGAPDNSSTDTPPTGFPSYNPASGQQPPSGSNLSSDPSSPGSAPGAGQS